MAKIMVEMSDEEYDEYRYYQKNKEYFANMKKDSIQEILGTHFVKQWSTYSHIDKSEVGVRRVCVKNRYSGEEIIVEGREYDNLWGEKY
jgi:hypothetical protein